ncbi:hypothetical protein D3C76_690140 [compost metagenome]
MAEIQQETRTQDAKCADGGNQQADASSQQGIADGHRDDQQVANGAGHTATGVEQHAKQQDIDQRQAEQLCRTAGVCEEDHQQDVQHQVQPAGVAQQVVIGGRQQPVVQVAGNQQHQGDADAQAVEVIEAQQSLGLFVAGTGRLSDHWSLGLAQGEPGCNTTVVEGSAHGRGAGARRNGRSGPWAPLPARRRTWVQRPGACICARTRQRRQSLRSRIVNEAW